MNRGPICSAADLAAYLDGDLISCFECGRRFRLLSHHLRRAHDMTPDQYRVRWNLPAGVPLAGLATREAHAQKARRLIEEGRLVPNAGTASAAALTAGRGRRVAWERAEQAQRAAQMLHETLPPGAKRADGRDADHAREYQRTYRRKKRGLC